MSVAEQLALAVKGIDSVTSRIRSSIKPARSLVEVKINNTLHSIANVFEEIGLGLRRLKCIVEVSRVEGENIGICGTWRITSNDSSLIIARLKQATVMRFEPNKVLFYSKGSKIVAEGASINMCKGDYCREVNLADTRTLREQLQQVIYLLKPLLNSAAKVMEAITVCARREAPDCARAR